MIDAFKSFFLTFYSVPFYQGLVKNGKGYGLWFIFIVTLFSCAQMTVQLAAPLRTFMEERKALFESIPALTLKDGILSIDAPSPVEVKLLEKTENGPIKILFDTQADDVDIDPLLKKMKEEKIIIAFTKSKFIFFDPPSGHAEITETQGLADAEVSHEAWNRIGEHIVAYFLPGFTVMSVLFTYSNQICFAFFGALLLMLAGKVLKFDLSVKASMRLASAAKVPVAAVLFFVPPQPLFAFLLWLGFAAFGLLSARKAA